MYPVNVLTKSDKCSWTVLYLPAVSSSAAALNSGYCGLTIGQIYFAGCGPFAKFPFSWELRVPGGSVQGEAVQYIWMCKPATRAFLHWDISYDVCTLYIILYVMFFVCICTYTVLYTRMRTLANGVVIYILGYQIPRAVFVTGLSEHVALIGPESSDTQE